MLKNKIVRASKEEVDALKACASSDFETAIKAQRAFAQNLEIPLREAVFEDDTLLNIYVPKPLEPGAQANFPMHFVAPGEQADYVAFTMPKQGRVPERHIEGDEVWVQTYRIANAIDWDLAYARDARWDIINGAKEVFKDGFVKKHNDDGWHVILACALAAGYMTQDTAAASGYFTKKLINRMKTVQKRREWKGKLTDIFVSPEGLEDIRRTLRSNAVNYNDLYNFLYDNVGHFKSPGDMIIKIGEHLYKHNIISIKEINFMAMVVESMKKGFI